jgi:heat shock protein HtpX
MKDRVSFHAKIAHNQWVSFFLIVIVFAVLLVLGAVIGLALGPDYFFIVMVITIIITLIYTVGGYYNSDKIALASVNAKPASPQEYRQYHNIVEGLCLASGMPKPKLYVMESNQINAFASGRDPEHSVICVTTGALEKLNKQELEGVLGHELSHIANYDIRFMTLTAVLVGMVAIISQIFIRSLWWSSIAGGRDRKSQAQVVFIIIGVVLAVLVPIAVYLVQFAISRKREYGADASAVKFIRSPTGLIGALEKIDRESASPEDRKHISRAVAPLFISDPLKKSFQNAFSTHPPLKKRIETLRRM